jgi:signal transduction histidine kinase
MTRTADTLELAVWDNGSGISPEVRPLMFNEGFTTKGADSHAGIGLSLVSDAVMALGGSIQLEDEDGAVFRVHVPHAFVETESLIP